MSSRCSWLCESAARLCSWGGDEVCEVLSGPVIAGDVHVVVGMRDGIVVVRFSHRFPPRVRTSRQHMSRAYRRPGSSTSLLAAEHAASQIGRSGPTAGRPPGADDAPSPVTQPETRRHAATFVRLQIVRPRQRAGCACHAGQQSQPGGRR